MAGGSARGTDRSGVEEASNIVAPPMRTRKEMAHCGAVLMCQEVQSPVMGEVAPTIRPVTC